MTLFTVAHGPKLRVETWNRCAGDNPSQLAQALAAKAMFS